LKTPAWFAIQATSSTNQQKIMNHYPELPDRTLKELEITQQILADSKEIADNHGLETLQLILNSLPNAANLPKIEPNPETDRPFDSLFDNSLEQEIYHVLRNR
jgi:hypothetical protein